VSPDGRMLCGCVEYWLPDGVNSAMELIEKKDELAWIEEERKDMKNTNERVATDSKNQEVIRCGDVIHYHTMILLMMIIIISISIIPSIPISIIPFLVIHTKEAGWLLCAIFMMKNYFD